MHCLNVHFQTHNISILDQFRDDFADKDLKVVLCKRKSQNGRYQWLEFIDVNTLGSSYVLQFDVSNFSGQIITHNVLQI